MSENSKELNATVDVTAPVVLAGFGVVAPELEVLLSSAAIGRTRREELIRKVFEGKASDVVLNFLLVLNSHERLNLLRPIVVALRELHDERAGRVRVQVASAAPLPDDQKQSLAEQLREALRREPILDLKVEPELIAGVRIRVGDWQYDGSVLRRLDDIRNQILTGTSHEIQSRRDRFSD